MSPQVYSDWARTRRTSDNFLVGEPLVVGDICRHVRFDEEREQVAALDVFLFDDAGAFLAVLQHNLRLLLLQQLHSNSLHRCACIFDPFNTAIRLDSNECTARAFHNTISYNIAESGNEAPEEFTNVEPGRRLEDLLERDA